MALTASSMRSNCLCGFDEGGPVLFYPALFFFKHWSLSVERRWTRVELSKRKFYEQRAGSFIDYLTALVNTVNTVVFVTAGMQA